MRRRTKLAATLIGVAAVVIALVAILRHSPGEGPVVNGRHLSEWVELLGTRTSNEHFFEAEDAVVRAGSNSFPYILKWIQSEQKPWRSKLPPSTQRVIINHRWLNKWLSTSTERRIDGANAAFALLRTNVPSETITELARLMNATNAPQTSYRAACLLASSGANGVPALASVLENPKHPLRWLVVRLFFVDRELATSGQAAVPGLIQCLSDPTRETPAIAAAALGKIKASPELTVPALLSCLQSPDPHLRRCSAEALGNFPEEATLFRPSLTNLLTDPDETVRQATTDSLKQIAPAAPTNAWSR